MRRLLLTIPVCHLILACSSSISGSGTSSGSGLAISGTSSGARGSASGSTGGTITGGTTNGGPTGGSGTSGETTGSGTTGGAIPDLGASCNPGDDPDPCATYGLVCDPVSSTCQLPGELEDCLSHVGCSDPSLVCTAGFENGGQPVSVCLYPCTQTADCPDLMTSCQNEVCFLNECQSGDNGALHYFEPCPSASSADGECLPVFIGFNEVAGVCVGAGSLTNGQSCVAARTDAGLAGLCQQGSDCVFFDGGVGHSSVNLCEPVCYSNDEVPGGGPTCPVGDLCFNFSSFFGYGNCFQNCAADAGQACPQGQFCDSFDFFTTPDAVCVPE